MSTTLTTSSTAATATSTSTSKGHPSLANNVHRGRTSLFWLSLILCGVGLSLQISNLQDFNKNQDHNRSTSKLTMAATGARQLDAQQANYFVPSLEYRSNMRSEYWEEVKVLQTNCVEKIKDLEWEWYGSNTTTTKHSNNKKLLIGLFAGFDPYADLLSQSATLAKLYANRHPDAQVVVLQGTAFAPQGCQPPGIHTTLNKIRLLFHAIDHSDEFDQVLLLEADAMITNMELDITTLLDITDTDTDSDDTFLVAAQPLRTQNSQKNQFLVNPGVTLWNLNHPLVKEVALQWFDLAKKALMKGTYHGDGKYLIETLRSNKAKVQFLDEEFHFHKGTVVKHYLRKSFKDRLRTVQQTAAAVCQEYGVEECRTLHKDYPTE